MLLLFRIMNLDLMLDYGAESWKQYNEVLQDMLTRMQVKLLFIGRTKILRFLYLYKIDGVSVCL